MTPLEERLKLAFESSGKEEHVNKVYLLLLRTPLFIPTQKEKIEGGTEPFQPLFAHIENHIFLPAFDTLERLTTWAGKEWNNMHYVELLGKELIAGMSDSAFLCLNIGSPFYKEFSPDEIKRLKMIIARIEQLAGGA